MRTTVYLIRHSEKLRNAVNIVNSDSFQLMNEKQLLSVEGERKAKLLSESAEMQNIDTVIASNYVRAVGTAKYIADKNNTDIKVTQDFGERKYGISSASDVIFDFERRQIVDESFKIGDGESQSEVRTRMYNALINVLDSYCGERIAIVSHGTAMLFLLGKWCDISLINNDDYKLGVRIKFNGVSIFEGNFSAPEIFKLIFDSDNLISIENIKIE